MEHFDWTRNDLGKHFCALVDINRVMYRPRRRLEIDVLEFSLLRYKYRYEVVFPTELFGDIIKDVGTYGEDVEDLIDQGLPATFTVPVFVTELTNPRGHYHVSDQRGMPLPCLNRYEGSQIWGSILESRFSQSLETLGAAADGFTRLSTQGTELGRLSNDPERLRSYEKVLTCLAWISGAATKERFDRFDPGALAVGHTLLGGFWSRLLFYKGIPLPCCSEEVASLRMFYWTIQEMCVLCDPRAAIAELDPNGAFLQGCYERIRGITSDVRHIQAATFKHRRRLRRFDTEAKNDVVFAEVCPAVNPLTYTRAYAKRRLHDLGFSARWSHDLLEIWLSDWLEAVEHYVSACRLATDVMCMLAYRARTEEEREAVTDTISLFNTLACTFRTWRVYALLDVVPNHTYEIDLEVLVTSPTSNQIRAPELAKRDRYVFQQAFSEESRPITRRRTFWLRFFLASELRCVFKAGFLYAYRGIYQQLVKVPKGNWGFIAKRQDGFMVKTWRGPKVRRYHAHSLSPLEIPDIFQGDTQTEHLTLDLEGTELEIRPEFTYVAAPQRVINRGPRARYLRWRRARFQCTIMSAAKALNGTSSKKSRNARDTARRKRHERKVASRSIRLISINNSLRKLSHSRRLAPETIFGGYYVSESRQFCHFYTTKTGDERLASIGGTRTDSKHNVRAITRPGRKGQEVVPEWYLDWKFILGLRLKREIRTAYYAIIGIYAAIVVSSYALYLGLARGTISRNYVPHAVLFALTGLGLMVAILTFFLSSQNTHIFTPFFLRYFRLSTYVLAVAQASATVLLVYNWMCVLR